MIRRLAAILACLTLCTSAPAVADPLAEPLHGPLTICFKYSTFDLLAEEQVTDFTGGPEGMAIVIDGPDGRYDIWEGEVLAIPRDRWHKHRPLPQSQRRLMSSQGATHVYRYPGSQPGYAIFGPTRYSDGKDALVLWVAGVALRDPKKAAAIYRRFDVRDPAGAQCGFTFTYGWR